MSDLAEPTTAELAEVAEGWRPYRPRVAVLLRARREDETAEITTGRRVSTR
ncbi:MAG TPA: hypothetical protein VHH15_21010 [Actinophytocola sp.]|nr:hypothetical protein [Actinophytocola sp.]